MRRSERDAALASVFRSVLAGARGAAAEAGVSLAIGSRVTPPDCTSAAPDLSHACALTQRFSGVLWVLPSDPASLRSRAATVRAGLVRLRGEVMLPGGTLLLVARERAPALQQLRGLLAGESVQRARLPALCNAVLAAGLLSPRVHGEIPGWLLVSAALSSTREPLDVFFEQPTVHDVR